MQPCSKAMIGNIEGDTDMRRTFGACIFLCIASGAIADDRPVLRPGEYEVQAKLELPHVENTSAIKTSKICVTDGETSGIVVLSDNNPLARCPASNIHRNGDRLTFNLVCEGHNQAVASAKFDLWPDRFTGVFEMKMGGKNMTMLEHQSGKRIGDCAR